ncbi:hypothetical protein KIN20_034675 [Parelaphostrongylus tenuis]|uniref:Uncharacterized protein n=1 Tax=Parelaphostrongylus tenuis TaxID=148309 RepID=A0AAD5RAD4_PARTN|nr:hypothetical protein KIN20_034675 [Parelaphostrongylus tenuis]
MPPGQYNVAVRVHGNKHQVPNFARLIIVAAFESVNSAPIRKMLYCVLEQN